MREKILQDYNVSVSPDAVRKYFKRHPEVEAELRKEVVSRELGNEVVEETIFQNGTFEELSSVKKWIVELTPRVSRKKLKTYANTLKNVCRGIFYLKKEKGMEKQQIENWTFKHPDRLTIEHAKEFLASLHTASRGTHDYRIALRSFFQSRGINIQSKDINGENEGVGKYINVYVEKAF